MKVRNGRWFTLCLCAGLLGVGAVAQGDPDAGTRDAFISTRRAPVKQRANAHRANARPNGVTPAGQSLGVGYTVYTMNKAGTPVRVSPNQEFHTGDALRFLVESNSDGYLYVFNRDGENPAKMIYPSPVLQAGSNRIRAHVPYQLPSAHEDAERQWFRFLSETPTREELCFVVTTEPLPGIPVGRQLVAYGETYQKASWTAPTDVWNVIQTALNRPARETNELFIGTQQKASEMVAVSREIGLAPSDPPPSKVKYNAEAANRMLVSRVELRSAGKRFPGN